MTDGLSESQVKWLTYLVYILLSTIAVCVGWLMVKQTELPEQFVRLERYMEDKKCTADVYTRDMSRVENALNLINQKLDRNFRQNDSSK